MGTDEQFYPPNMREKMYEMWRNSPNGRFALDAMEWSSDPDTPLDERMLFAMQAMVFAVLTVAAELRRLPVG